MAFYIKVYDHEHDVDCQCELNAAQAQRARARNYGVSDGPFEGPRIVSSNIADWARDFASEPEGDEQPKAKRGRPKKHAEEQPAEEQASE